MNHVCTPYRLFLTHYCPVLSRRCESPASYREFNQERRQFRCFQCGCDAGFACVILGGIFMFASYQVTPHLPVAFIDLVGSERQVRSSCDAF